MIRFNQRNSGRNRKSRFSGINLAFEACDELQELPSRVFIGRLFGDCERNRDHSSGLLHVLRKNSVTPLEVFDLLELQHLPATVHTHRDTAGHKRFTAAQLLGLVDRGRDTDYIDQVGDILNGLGIFIDIGAA